MKIETWARVLRKVFMNSFCKRSGMVAGGIHLAALRGDSADCVETLAQVCAGDDEEARAGGKWAYKGG